MLVVQNPPVKAGDVRDLGSVPEELMETHSSILAWRILWTEEPGGLHPWGRKESDSAEAT